MTEYNVTAILTVRVENPAALTALSASRGVSNQEERAQVEAVVELGLAELSRVATRYGFAITNSSATVEPA